MQSANSYCKLNYGLPTELTYTDDDVSGTPELGKNSSFRVLYNVIEGHLGSVQPGVTYVTHLTKNFVNYLAEVVRYVFFVRNYLEIRCSYNLLSDTGRVL